MWAIAGILSVVFCILGWILAVKQNPKALRMCVCSLAFTALTLLLQYRMVLGWVSGEDWSALRDVIPSAYKMLAGYVTLLLLANAGVIHQCK